MVMVGNHQNGMMDALNICGVMTRQFHWLTRADVFWNPFAKTMLYSFNQMPIYRQKDRLEDLRERNEIIWNCCIERLEMGASMALFPEGNHNPERHVRSLKRGVSDLIGKSYAKHKSLERLKLIPFGLDYEEYPTYRRRLALRAGEPIEWVDLFDEESGLINYVALNKRISEALSNLTTDIQPAKEYKILDPFVRALRTTESAGSEWKEKNEKIKELASKAENQDWLEKVRGAFEELEKAGYNSSMRPEAWGLNAGNIRRKNYLAVLLRPLSWVLNAPTALQQFLLNRRGEKIKAIEFRSTMKIGAGMFIYPLTWTLMAIAVGLLLASYKNIPFLYSFIGFWSWATWGNKFYGKLQDKFFDHKDAIEGEKFWKDKKMSALRDAWNKYTEVMKS